MEPDNTQMIEKDLGNQTASKTSMAMRLVNKLSSGRFIMTVSVAMLMLYIGVTVPESFKDMKEFIAVVIYAYFNREEKK